MNAIVENIALNSQECKIRKPESAQSESVQIDELIAQFAKAWNQRDAASFSSLFETDGDFGGVIGRPVKGYARIACEFLTLNRESAGVVALRNPEVAVEFLAPHTAVAVTRWQLDGDRESSQTSPLYGWATYVLVKRGDRWLIRNARISRILSMARAA